VQLLIKTPPYLKNMSEKLTYHGLIVSKTVIIKLPSIIFLEIDRKKYWFIMGKR